MKLNAMSATTCRNCGSANAHGATCARCKMPLDVVVERSVKGEVAAIGRRRGSGMFLLLGIIAAAGGVFWLSAVGAPSKEEGSSVGPPSVAPGDPLARAAATTRSEPPAPNAAAPPEIVPPPSFTQAQLGQGDPEADPASIPNSPPDPEHAQASSTEFRNGALRVLRAQSGAIRKCYQAGLNRDPQLRGNVLVKIAIGADGKVTLASPTSSDVNDPAVLRCIAQRVRESTFPPPPEGSATINYPVILSAP